MNIPETSASGNIHGMPFAATLGFGPEALPKIFGYAPKLQGSNCALVGVRDLDERERRIVRESGIHVFTMRDIEEYGMRKVMEKDIGRARRENAGFYVSLARGLVYPDHVTG